MKSLRLTEADYAAILKRNPRVKALVRDAKPVAVRKAGSALEERLVQQLEDVGYKGTYKREYYPILGRDFRLDFAWVPEKKYVEVQGMAHRIKGKFRADIEKRALLTLAGWRGLEVGGAEIKSGKAIEWIKELLK